MIAKSRAYAIAVVVLVSAVLLPAQDALAVSRIWTRSYNGPGSTFDGAAATVADPGNHRVYVAGYRTSPSGSADYVVIAYAADGTRLWTAGYNGGINGSDFAHAIAVDPETHNVYVTGQSQAAEQYVYATVAFDAGGTRLWQRYYGGPGTGPDSATAIAVDRVSHDVFVTGNSSGVIGDDYATVAYGADGSRLWARRYNGPAGGPDDATSVTVDPNAGLVEVTGFSEGASTSLDFVTVAYTLAGAMSWTRRYSGGHGIDQAYSISADPGNHHVYVTGASQGAAGDYDYATLAYNGLTGDTLWARRLDGAAGLDDRAAAVAVDQGNHTAYVTGISLGTSSNDYVTVAYHADGSAAGSSRYNSAADGADQAVAVTVDPVHHRAYVTGDTTIDGDDDYKTVAYGSGLNQLWAAGYSGAGHGADSAAAISVDQTNQQVYVTGTSWGGTGSANDIVTVAYPG